jgi:hypothetical protein
LTHIKVPWLIIQGDDDFIRRTMEFMGGKWDK